MAPTLVLDVSAYMQTSHPTYMGAESLLGRLSVLSGATTELFGSSETRR
jgi:hypothetical protein